MRNIKFYLIILAISNNPLAGDNIFNNDDDTTAIHLYSSSNISAQIYSVFYGIP